MRTIWHSLAWKEWHEHKWKLASLTAILCGVSAILMFNTEGDDALTVYFGVLVYTMLPLAIFLGASEAADERGRGTLPVLQSIPVRMWQNACWKLVFGIGTCLVPIAVSLCLVNVWYTQTAVLLPELYPPRNQLPLIVDFDNLLVDWTVSAALFASIVGVSFYLWTAAVGVNSKDQVRAGAMALLVIVLWWSVVGFTAAGIDHEWLKLHGAPLVTAVLGISPGGLGIALTIAAGPGRPVLPFSIVGAVAIGIVFHVALAAWFVVRFGRTKENDNYSPQNKGERIPSSQGIGLPRRYALTAIIWKQFRESTPIALLGLAGITCFFAANVLSDSEFYAENEHRVANLLISLTMVIGFIVAMAVGIGVFDRDLGPKVNEFWRSRPIHPDLWFWSKYFTGLGVIFVVLYLPLLIGSLWAQAPFYPIDLEGRMAILLQVAVYTTALAMICLVRQPVYAAILGIGTLLLGVSVALYFFRAEKVEFGITIFAVESVTAVLATLVAWLAVRYDWGWRNR